MRAHHDAVRVLRACVVGALVPAVASCGPTITLGGGGGASAPPPPSVDSTPRGTSAAQEIVSYTNAARRRQGLPPLAPNSRLMRAAELHAQQMARSGTLSHDIPGAPYPTPKDRLDAVGYNWRAYAENVSWNQRDARAAVDGWMTSTGHRENILNLEYTEIGAGLARSSKGEPYYVQVFGRPASR